MIGWRGFVSAAALAAGSSVFGCLGVAAEEPPGRTLACGGEAIARGVVSRVIDGRTFVLDDGHEVRLAGIEVPPLRSSDGAAAPGGAAAKAALAAVLDGAEVVLKRAQAQDSDRYGRIVAYVFAVGEDGEISAQSHLVEAGLARVAARVGSRECAAELLGRENKARVANLGLWRISYYEILAADDPAAVLAQRGRYALVVGRVVSVGESGATIYVNFGQRWTEDFTVTIRKRNVRNFTAAGIEPKRLSGTRVRVRGWVEQHGGPWIEAAQPEQIELMGRD